VVARHLIRPKETMSYPARLGFGSDCRLPRRSTPTSNNCCSSSLPARLSSQCAMPRLDSNGYRRGNSSPGEALDG
jgi:hypothetical protein